MLETSLCLSVSLSLLHTFSFYFWVFSSYHISLFSLMSEFSPKENWLILFLPLFFCSSALTDQNFFFQNFKYQHATNLKLDTEGHTDRKTEKDITIQIQKKIQFWFCCLWGWWTRPMVSWGNLLSPSAPLDCSYRHTTFEVFWIQHA